uniref:Putative secreted protein n=1 Tax=Anopheles marajoara TaxID=58244 RepID=A0A2M4CDC3_9DIPT
MIGFLVVFCGIPAEATVRMPVQSSGLDSTAHPTDSQRAPLLSALNSISLCRRRYNERCRFAFAFAQGHAAPSW